MDFANIDRALELMDSYTRNTVKQYIQKYKDTGDRDYLYQALAIIENYADDSDDPKVKELIKRL